MRAPHAGGLCCCARRSGPATAKAALRPTSVRPIPQTSPYGARENLLNGTSIANVAARIVRYRSVPVYITGSSNGGGSGSAVRFAPIARARQSTRWPAWRAFHLPARIFVSALPMLAKLCQDDINVRQRVNRAMNESADEILTIEEVATYLKAGRRTVYRLAANGQIPAFKLGGVWRFHRAELERWIAARIITQEGKPKPDEGKA